MIRSLVNRFIRWALLRTMRQEMRLVLAGYDPEERFRSIKDRDDKTLTYITRCYLLWPRHTLAGDLFNIHLHRVHRSDVANEFHTHPGGNLSVILTGGYVEHTPKGSFVRRPGDLIFRTSRYAHRLDLIPGVGPTYTLFVTWGWFGHLWGFLVNGKVVDHKDYLKARRTT
jgi:hypothetical protein